MKSYTVIIYDDDEILDSCSWNTLEQAQAHIDRFVLLANEALILEHDAVIARYFTDFSCGRLIWFTGEL